MKNIVLSSVLVVTALLLVGCMSPRSSYGTKMDSAKVNQIQKGVTTEQQLLAMCGQPLSTSLMPDGRRMLMFMYNETNMKLTGEGRAFIPIVGPMLVGSRGDRQQQMLQAYIKDGIVQDFVFNDSTSHIENGPFNHSVTPVASPAGVGTAPVSINASDGANDHLAGVGQ